MRLNLSRRWRAVIGRRGGRSDEGHAQTTPFHIRHKSVAEKGLKLRIARADLDENVDELVLVKCLHPRAEIFGAQCWGRCCVRTLCIECCRVVTRLLVHWLLRTHSGRAVL